MPEEPKKEPRRSAPGIDLEKKIVKCDYIKSNYFRVVHVSGAWGGPAPSENQIHMSVFSERWPIPNRTANKLMEDGKLGGEIEEERVCRDAIVREIEVDLVMTIEVATTIRDWLNDKIEKHKPGPKK